ncbi:Crp/Fnr family transcriptional regulator [Lacinutrix sp. 5H-3-7-4]|uniref:Crp/Fnr family transcriptional regulator n=1 Tax=Lacinutrix sp. (strain 5H-3-7-4) TaxID=983544 RepID=UPI00020A375D|nr:Crp/Fnr family transcriptional regulator [Lacinutrix sp. 5H-3-7-4]AEH02189.1 putative transcriptional regulator, Crp/Fnr family [Lacinutrix sp. 5H-3-7-4]
MKPYYKESFDYINSFSPISESVFEKMYDATTYKVVTKGTKLLNLGNISQKIYLITNGVVRSYVVFDDGKEVTKSLFDSIMFFASFNSLLNKKPSDTIYETITDCHIFEIDFGFFKRLCLENVSVLQFYSKFLEYLILEKEKTFLDITTKNAKERYLKLRDRIPNIDKIMPQYEIASCLGITPVQLSRIRSKLNAANNEL